MVAPARRSNMSFRFQMNWAELSDGKSLLIAVIVAVGSLDRLLETGSLVIYDPKEEEKLRYILPRWMGGRNDSAECEQVWKAHRREIIQRHGKNYLKDLKKRIMAGPTMSLDELETVDD